MATSLGGLEELRLASEVCWGHARAFFEAYSEVPQFSDDEWAATQQADATIREATRFRGEIIRSINNWEAANGDDSLELINAAVGIGLPPIFIKELSYQTAHEAVKEYAREIVRVWRVPDELDELRKMLEWLQHLANALLQLPPPADPWARLQGEFHEANRLPSANAGTLPPTFREKVLDTLTKQQRAIISRLWDSPVAVSYDSLLEISNAWRDVPDDAAIDKALKRLSDALSEHFPSITLENRLSRRTAKLILPRDK